MFPGVYQAKVFSCGGRRVPAPLTTIINGFFRKVQTKLATRREILFLL